MEISRLIALRELSLRKTMAAVAEALHVTPSAISQQITQLEDEVGIQLIERRGRGVELTNAGWVLVEHANKVFEVVQEARSSMEHLKIVVAGELRISAFSSVTIAFLPFTMQALKMAFPKLKVKYNEMEPEEALKALRSWESNVAIIDDLNTPPGTLEDTIETLPLLQDRFVILLPEHHPLTQKSILSFHDLREEEWVIDATASNNYTKMISNECQRAGFEPDIVARCRGFDGVSAFVRQGCAISIMPALRARYEMEGTVIRELYPNIKREIFIAYNKSEKKTPALQAFIRQIKLSVDESTLS